ncbi:hypothetical protein RJ639_022707 [Escallonia herrerae]|uniref:Uncharacterized protein n=1 Tax=Escallonia herrerae TaxID=1293975 RepID=A0AA89ADE4_9ASTE|nr:hypothetical protein RJ639_022707 [Escallonia herrerae]
MKLAEEIRCSLRAVSTMLVILLPVLTRTQERQSYLIVPSVGIQAARGIISSLRVSIAVRVRVACQNRFASNVTAPLVQRDKVQRKEENWQTKVCKRIAMEQNFPNDEIIELYLNKNKGNHSGNNDWT